MKMMRMPRGLMRAFQAGALGVALLAGTAASCTPDDYPVVGGDESTSQVCTDLGSQLPPLVGPLTASPLILSMDPDHTPAHQAQQVKNTRNSFGELSDALRAEAGNAADPGLATALGDTADGVDAQGAKIQTVSDIESIDDSTVDTSKLDPYCPDLEGQLGG